MAKEYTTGGQMSKDEQRITQERYVRWATMIPNLYDDLGLSVHEFRLLIHYCRVGNCWESVSRTAEICRMNRETVIRCRKSLESKGLIRVSLSRYGTLSVVVLDIWKKNFDYYSSRTSRKEGMGVVPKTDRTSRKEGTKEKQHKNNPIRITHQEQQQQHAHSRGDPDAVVAVLKESGLNEGPAMRLAREGVITLDVALAWREWLADPPKAFRSPVGYAAQCLASDPTVLPPKKRRTWYDEKYAQFVNR